ncbi:MAG: hypothetical protein QY331_01970 [Melioribacteraceae bacterium]|nr:MAG: hypothetical protein QY331_01970 [Melioribacteraceae bacterium]
MEIESHPQLKVIEDNFYQAGIDGAFTNLWYFIRDISNLIIEFGLEIDVYLDDETYIREYIVIGELYREGLKLRNGEYLPLKIEDYPGERKYELIDMVKNKDGEEIDQQGLRMCATTNYRLAANFHYQPNKYDMQNIAVEQIAKLNEALLFFIFGDKKFKEFLLQVSHELMLEEHEYLQDFSACLNVTTNYVYDDNQTARYTLIYMTEEGAIEEFFAISSSKYLDQLANQFIKGWDFESLSPSLPKSIIDMINDVEQLIEKRAPLKTILKEYHTVFENYFNQLYLRYYDQILEFEKKITNEADRKKYFLDEIKKSGEGYGVSNLRSAKALLLVLTHERIETFDQTKKELIKSDLIPALDFFSPYSMLRNLATHSKAPNYMEGLFNYGIRAYKDILRSLHITLNRN